MRVCIPVEEDRGLSSELHAHFGSAPCFLIVDVDSGDVQAVPNQNANHVHGHCNPLASIQHAAPTTVIVAGIGRGALHRLRAAHIKVFRTDARRVEEALKHLQGGLLSELEPEEACAHGGSECAHP